jgi:hypothetical protein
MSHHGWLLIDEQSLVFCVVFCRSLFLLFSFFGGPLFCLSVFDVWLLITLLIFSSFLVLHYLSYITVAMFKPECNILSKIKLCHLIFLYIWRQLEYTKMYMINVSLRCAMSNTENIKIFRFRVGVFGGGNNSDNICSIFFLF